MANINVNGTPTVFNSVLVSVDGDTDFPINYYVLGIDYTTGSGAANVKAFHPQGKPIANNPIIIDPSATLKFAPMMDEAFYAFLNNRFSTFTMQLIQYVTGNLAGPKKTLLIENGRRNEMSGNMNPTSANHEGSMSIVATDIRWI
jgi:hypothetical protein